MEWAKVDALIPISGIPISGISNFIYSLTMLEADKNICKLAQNELSKFKWGSKPPKVKHSTLIGNIEKGGLKAVDVEIMSKALMINWISRFWETKHWNSIINEGIDKYGGIRFLLRCYYDFTQIKIPNFYRNVL